MTAPIIPPLGVSYEHQLPLQELSYEIKRGKKSRDVKLQKVLAKNIQVVQFQVSK